MSIWKDKARAGSIHLGLSAMVAVMAAALVFGLWFPYPYRDISGGRELFVLVTVVDIAMGPLLTLVIYNRNKSWREKILDFSLIGFLQLAALSYGLWSVAQARPVHLVFSYDRFNVVTAADIAPETLAYAPEPLQTLPWLGPTTISLRPLVGNETLEVTLAELDGLPAAARPQLWQSYEMGRATVRRVARPATELMQRFAPQSDEIARVLQSTGRAVDTLVYVPMKARKNQFWTVIIDRQSADVLAFLPLDSF